MWHELKVDSVTTIYLHEDGDVEIEVDEGYGYYACKRSSYIKASVLSSWLATAMAKESSRTDAQQTNGAEPTEITPCPCEKDIACTNGHVGMEDCPKYVKTA